MLLSESKFNLQSINISEFDQESDQESDSDSKLKLKVNQDLIEEAISIQNQIIANNHMNQLCINIQTAIEQNRKTCQDIDLNNCQVLDEVL
jgi:tartrate dehydratase alpha subunit/fumarate hydratase class I-like protein